jgi:hypothetical protein
VKYIVVSALAAIATMTGFWAFRQHIRLTNTREVLITDVVPWVMAGSALGAVGGMVVCDRYSTQGKTQTRRALEQASRNLNVPLEHLAVIEEAKKFIDEN